MSSSKGVLSKELGDLLGFEDGAEDVLEHLLSIESSEDLLDYLSQLLGQDGEAVKSFVENVGKFQRGENLVQASIGGSQQQQKLATKQPQQTQDSYIASKAPVNSKIAWQDKAKSQQQQGRGNKQQPKRPTVPAAKNPAAAAAQASKPQPVVKKTPPPAVVTTKTVEIKNKATAAPKSPPKKSHPKKGKASHVCGCFGTVHKPLANCLYCGRVSCHKEGFDFCAFCGLMVEKVDVDAPTEGAKNKAWLHKERLLRFDRDFAQRTVVLDDQEDYYANATSTWLTEDEQIDAQDQEEARRKNMHDRKKQTLSLAI